MFGTNADVMVPAVVAALALSAGALADVPPHQVLGALSFAAGWLAGTGARLAARGFRRAPGGP
jgi:hypothetical protein